MIRISVNRDVCDGFGNCVLAAEDIFELDENDVVRLKTELVDSNRAAALRRAAYDCPTNAISFIEE